MAATCLGTMRKASTGVMRNNSDGRIVIGWAEGTILIGSDCWIIKTIFSLSLTENAGENIYEPTGRIAQKRGAIAVGKDRRGPAMASDFVAKTFWPSDTA